MARRSRKLVKHGVGITESEAERLHRYSKDVMAKQEEERRMAKPSIHQKMAEEAENFKSHYSFFCEECQEDFVSPAYKVVHRFYGDYIVTYRAIHEENEDDEECGEECIRLVTHRDHDPYYWLSDKVNRERNEYSVDLLQAEQYGFKTHYGNPWGETEDKLKEREEKILSRAREMGLRGDNLATQERLRRFRGQI